jgi:hypothetical protein
MVARDLEELIEHVDRELMTEVDKDPTGCIRRLYDFFDASEKPLNPREFFQFLGCLTPEENIYYLFALEGES